MTVLESDNAARLHHRSPGITVIYNELKSSRKNRILDLGASSGASFSFFAHLSCNIRFENLGDFFATTDTTNLENDQIIELLGNYLSRFNPNEKFDVVLTWDMFDYLDLPVIEWLIKRLSASFSPNTLLHSVRSVSKCIPPTPKSFQVTDQYQLNIKSVGAPQLRQYPCHNTAKLLKHLPHCYMENSYLNYDGMVPSLTETVMRFEPNRSVAVRRQTSDELAPGKHYNDQQSAYRKLSHRSLALASVFNRLSSDANVLDLGLKNKNNYDFLYGCTHNVYAENIFQTLNLPQNRSADRQLKPHVFNFPVGTTFDLILMWDILNFLSAGTISLLFERLSPFITSNTEIHVALYSGSAKPDQPQQFHIQTKDTVQILAAPKTENYTALNSSGLLKAIRFFQLRDTYVFREGMQSGICEYIITRQPNH